MRRRCEGGPQGQQRRRYQGATRALVDPVVKRDFAEQWSARSRFEKATERPGRSFEVGVGGGIPPSPLLGRTADFWGAESAQHFWPRGASTWFLASLPPLPPPLKNR